MFENPKVAAGPHLPLGQLLLDSYFSTPNFEHTKDSLQLASGLPQITAHTVRNFSLQSGRTLDSARAGWCVYATENGEPIDLSKFDHAEVELGRKVVLVLPALTGSAIAKVPEGAECSQGDGWANHWIDSQARVERDARLKGESTMPVFLDSDRYTIVVVDHFGGNGSPGSTTSAQELFALGAAAEVTIRDGVNLIAQALRERGLKEIHAVIGGSIGGGQAFQWMFQEQIPVRHVVDISGSTCQDQKAREFFRIQRDLLANDPDISQLRVRLLANISELVAKEQERGAECSRVEINGEKITPFEYIVRTVDGELASFDSHTSVKQRLECVRRIGFLLFLPPGFYQEKFDRYTSEMDQEAAQTRLNQWFERHGTEFSARFTPEALWTLCNMNGECEMVTAEQVASRMIEKGISLTGTAVNGDTLFPVENHRALYGAIEEQLYASGDYEAAARLMSVEITDHRLGHDGLFDDESFRPLGMIIRQRLDRDH